MRTILCLSLLVAVVVGETCHQVGDCHVTTCSSGSLACERGECTCSGGGGAGTCIQASDCHCQRGQAHCVDGHCQCR